MPSKIILQSTPAGPALAKALVLRSRFGSTIGGMQRLLIVAGALLLVVGLAWPWLSRLGLGRLPGDIRVETENGLFYFPITSGLLVSAVLSLLVWLFRR
jgi:hypothetical protein